MKRYSSLDFLRGLAIILMLFLHMGTYYLAIDPILANINNEPLINLVALIIFPYLGGLAGLFLLISSIVNMISMYKRLERGQSVKNLILGQVVAGVLLLIFAMLVEALIGYNGALGNLLQHLDDPNQADLLPMLYRWNTFETIHTIAWCVIINGTVQGILSRNGKWKNSKRLMIIYITLAIIIVALTQFVWDTVALLVPGYPFALDPSTGIEIYQPVLGQANPLYILVSPFLAALAAPMEPLFPYLAVSFIGSMIGLVITKPREEIPFNFPKRMGLVGGIMFFIGMIGVTSMVFYVFNTQGFNTAADFFQLISYHRHWAPDYPYITIPAGAWLWQFFSFTGFSILAVMTLLRLVEYRGKAGFFADSSTIIRRFGFVAFTNYSFQWIYYITFFLMTNMLVGTAYQKLDWSGTFLTIGLTFFVYELMMVTWEKKRYIGSIEWMIGTLAFTIFPKRKIGAYKGQIWWERGALNVEESFYAAEWVNIVKEHEIKHEIQKESKLAYKLALISVCTLVFMPIAFVAYNIANESIQTEQENKYNKRAKIISIIGMALVVIFFALCFFLTPSDVGLVLK